MGHWMRVRHFMGMSNDDPISSHAVKWFVFHGRSCLPDIFMETVVLLLNQVIPNRLSTT